jgi:hypothetical protein
MSHPPTSLFADMLGLLKELEWQELEESASRKCPVCDNWEPDGTFNSCNHDRKISAIIAATYGHAPGCHLQATIALAEEHLNVR